MHDMRFYLYEVEIERSSGWSKAHVVAPSEQRAAELIFDQDTLLGQDHLQFTLERVDETLSGDQRKGLDDMLDNSPVGIASYNKTIGWIGHIAAVPQLQLFGIEDSMGSQTYVIAPNKDIAATLYLGSNVLSDGEQRIFRFFDGLADLPPDHIHSLDCLLEFGPVGVVDFHPESGWSVS